MTGQDKRRRTIRVRASSQRRGNPNDVLRQARLEFEASVASGEFAAIARYASVLYGILQDDSDKVRRWKVWHLPHALRAFFLLKRFLLEQLFTLSPEYWPSSVWTPTRCERVSSILLTLARSRRLPVGKVTRPLFIQKGLSILNMGIHNLSNENALSHTRALMLLSFAEICLERSYTLDKRGESGAAESDRHTAERCIAEAVECAYRATDNNQQSRCYRRAALLYCRLGDKDHAKLFIKAASEVPGITANVVQRNLAARKLMRL